MAPLSGKQHREYLKFQNKEAREASKMGLDEMRKQQLHEIKLQEAAAKANQGLGHKEQVNNAKLKDMGIPPARMNKQKLGIPTQNPLAGTGMFKQGQRSLAQAPIFQAKGTDTVPAMLTPGEAVIPRAAAQDPKNKKAIKRMVKEGREANRLRDGAVDVRYSDAPGQAKYHADGTMQVPSLAYEHPDVPGSSFEDGTERVYDFKRGSAQQANYSDGTEHVFSRGSPDMQHYNNGTYGVVPQQVQSAAGYFGGTEGANDSDIEDQKKKQEVVPMIIQPTETAQLTPIWDPSRAVEGEQYANMVAVDNRVPQPAVATPVVDQTPSTAVITEPQVVATPVAVNAPAPLSAPAVAAVPAMFAGQPVTTTAVVPPVAVDPNQMTTDELIARDKANIQNTPTVAVVPPKDDPYAGLEPTLRKDYLDPAKASKKVQSVEEIVAQLHGESKTEKSFTDSLANLFTVNGFKEELGLNNQDIIRMAISTAVGARKFGVNRALAYAGRQAFEESSKRNAQAQADKRSIRAAAVQIHGQQIRDARAEENALAKENRDVAREDARIRHAEFMAKKNQELAELKNQWTIDRDDKKLAHQSALVYAQIASMENRMLSNQAHQTGLVELRAEMNAKSGPYLTKDSGQYKDLKWSPSARLFTDSSGKMYSPEDVISKSTADSNHAAVKEQLKGALSGFKNSDSLTAGGMSAYGLLGGAHRGMTPAQYADVVTNSITAIKAEKGNDFEIPPNMLAKTIMTQSMKLGDKSVTYKIGDSSGFKQASIEEANAITQRLNDKLPEINKQAAAQAEKNGIKDFKPLSVQEYAQNLDNAFYKYAQNKDVAAYLRAESRKTTKSPALLIAEMDPKEQDILNALSKYDLKFTQQAKESSTIVSKLSKEKSEDVLKELHKKLVNKE